MLDDQPSTLAVILFLAAMVLKALVHLRARHRGRKLARRKEKTPPAE